MDKDCVSIMFKDWSEECERVGATTFSPHSLGFLRKRINAELDSRETLIEDLSKFVKMVKEWYAPTASGGYLNAEDADVYMKAKSLVLKTEKFWHECYGLAEDKKHHD